jgi:hypothetical protein
MHALVLLTVPAVEVGAAGLSRAVMPCYIVGCGSGWVARQ